MNILILNRAMLANRPYRRWIGPGHRLVLITAAGSVSEDPATREEQLAEFDEVLVLDAYDDNPRVEFEALRLHRVKTFDQILAMGEFDLLRAARLRELLGLPGQSVHSALLYRDKIAMKERLADAGIPTVAHAPAPDATAIHAFAAEHGYRIVIKPRRGAGSVGVEVLRDDAELEAYALRTPQLGKDDDAWLMVEAYTPHRLYHVDGLVIDGRTRLIWPSTQADSTCLGVFDGRPSQSCMLDEDDPMRAPLCEMTQRVLGALPTPENAMFHAEIFETDGGLVVNEIGSRMAGGRIEEALAIGFGISLPEVYVRAVTGQGDIEIPARPQRIGGRILFPPRPGTLVSVPGECDIPGIVGFTVRAREGATLNQPRQSIDTFASAVAVGSTRAEVEIALARLVRWVGEETKIVNDAESTMEKVGGQVMTARDTIPPTAESTTLLLWDIDGTLLNPAGFGRRCFRAAYEQEFGCQPAVQVAMAGRTDRAIAADFLAAGGTAEPHRIDAFLERMVSIARGTAHDFRRQGAHLLAGTEAALRAAAARPGIVQSVLTGNLEGIATIKLSETGIDGLLNLDIAAFGDHRLDRADLVTEVWSRAAVKLKDGDSLRARTVIIGDTPLDVVAALTHGARVIAVATGDYDARQLRHAGAHAVLDSLEDTAAFLRMVESVAT